MPTVELLAPAGNPEALDAALGEGADAVYLGARSFNARMRSANFAFNQLEAAVDVCRKKAKKVYVTVNTVFEQREADRMWQLLGYLERVGPDGIIVQDFGVAKMAREHFPKLALHASTQMNVASAKGVNFLSRHGFKRAVLARELSLDEIRSIRASTNLELEVFVHGALCACVSGLCLFSSYLGGKSANRGACAQACRRLYSAESASGYWFSPDDLELIGYVPDLMEAGVESFKIEGRMKSAEYVGAVTAAYRYMIDNWKLDRERALDKARAMLQSDFARRKTRFFIDGKLDEEFIKPDQAGGTGIPLGKVRDIRALDEGRYMLLDGFGGLAEGDSLRFHRADDSSRWTAKVRDAKEVPNGLLVRVDADFKQGDVVYLVQTKSMARRYAPVLPRDLARYRRFPGYKPAPEPEAAGLPPQDLARELKALGRTLPDGLYALVGRVADLHVLNAARPEKAMILFDRASAAQMRAEEATLPFKRDSLVLWLDPWFPEADAEWLASELEYWTGRGQRLFVANNPGHFPILRSLASKAAAAAEARLGSAKDPAARRASRMRAPRGRDGRGPDAGVTVIAGPWLYAFNRWAASFLLEEGARFIVPPLEISKQGLQGAAEGIPPSALMPVVFSYPALFRMRADLASRYDFSEFADRDGSRYSLAGAGEGSVVTPAEPFSLVDRIPFLQKGGIGKFILDFSRVKLAKPLYKQVAKAASEGIVLPETNRFNWKDGFWRGEEGSRSE
jgi:U32 family peptidase